MKEVEKLMKEILTEASTGKVQIINIGSGEKYQVTKKTAQRGLKDGTYKLPQKDKQSPPQKPIKPKTNKKIDITTGEDEEFDLNDLLSNPPSQELGKKANIFFISLKSQVEKLASDKSNPNREDHKKVLSILSKVINNQKINEEQNNLLSSYVRLAQTAGASAGKTCKVYIAREPNNWNRSSKTRGAKKVQMGGQRNSKSRFFGKVSLALQKMGIKTVQTTSYGGKLTTANKTYTDSTGKTKLIDYKKEVKRNSKGKIQSVTIGNTVIQRLSTKQPGLSPQQIKMRQKNNRLLEKWGAAIEKNDLSFIDMDDGVVPDTSQNRVTVIKGSISGMADRLISLSNEAGVTDTSTIKLLENLKDFAQEDPNENPQEWHRKLNAFMSQISNHEGKPSLKQAWANIAEIYVAINLMHAGGKGTQHGVCALLPQSTNLKTVDVLSIDINHPESNIVTLNGTSVKAGKGGASAAYAKVQSTQFKNDQDGTFKEKLLDLAGSYNDIFETDMDDSLAKHKSSSVAYMKSLHEKALACGVQKDVIDGIEKELEDSQAVKSALQFIRDTRKKAGLSISPQDMAKIKLRLENYYRHIMLTCHAYNENVDVQDFINISVTSQKKDPGGSKLIKNKDVHISQSDGVNRYAYNNPVFNAGFRMDGRPNNPGASRLVNLTPEEYELASFSRHNKNNSQIQSKNKNINIQNKFRNKTLGNYITQLRSSEYCTIRDRKEIALLKRVKSTQECFKKNQKLLDEGMHKKTITQILYQILKNKGD